MLGAAIFSLAYLMLAPADLSGVRRLVRALKRGEAIGMLPDQVPSNGEGVWARFFGKPAYTMTLPARLQRRTGAALLLARGERLADGQGWTVHFSVVDEALPVDPVDAATRINAALERLIRDDPEQYLWGYNRYKTPRSAPPAPGQVVGEESDRGVDGVDAARDPTDDARRAANDGGRDEAGKPARDARRGTVGDEGTRR